MTEELEKQGGVDDAVAAGLVEETAVTSTELDDAAKAAVEREARRQALYEENERAEDERARAEAERMRDVDDEEEGETPRDNLGDGAPPVERGRRRPLALLHRVCEHCVLCYL